MIIRQIHFEWKVPSTWALSVGYHLVGCDKPKRLFGVSVIFFFLRREVSVFLVISLSVNSCLSRCHANNSDRQGWFLVAESLKPTTSQYLSPPTELTTILSHFMWSRTNINQPLTSWPYIVLFTPYLRAHSYQAKPQKLDEDHKQTMNPMCPPPLAHLPKYCQHRGLVCQLKYFFLFDLFSHILGFSFRVSRCHIFTLLNLKARHSSQNRFHYESQRFGQQWRPSVNALHFYLLYKDDQK